MPNSVFENKKFQSLIVKRDSKVPEIYTTSDKVFDLLSELKFEFDYTCLKNTFSYLNKDKNEQNFYYLIYNYQERQHLLVVSSLKGNTKVEVESLFPSIVKEAKIEERESIPEDDALIHINPQQALFSGRFACDLETNESQVSFLKFKIRSLELERKWEKEGLNSIIKNVSFLDSYAPFFHEINICKLLEEAKDFEVSEKAQAIRMILMEFSRIHAHSKSLYQFFSYFGLEEERSRCFDILKRTSDILSVGKQKNERIISLGGVTKDIPRDWFSTCLRTSSELIKDIRKLDRLVSSGRCFTMRTHANKLEQGLSFNHTVSGPTLRSMGFNYDIRKTDPCYFYDDVDFEIPLGLNGTILDYYNVIVEECYQSCSIISQLLDNLPEGENHKSCDLQFNPTREAVSNFCSQIEGPNGEISTLLSLNAKAEINKISFYTPSQTLLKFYEKSLIGSNLDETLQRLAITGLTEREASL